MTTLEWSDYQSFLAIARTGQLARAAEIAGVNATTIGRRLRRLEARLGASLFEQTRSGQELTEAGESLLIAVEEMAAAAARISESASAEGGLSGTLRISVSEGFGTWFVTRHLPRFAARHPGLTVDLVANSGFLNPSKREADIAVMLSRPRSGPVLCRKLADYRLKLYASADYLAEHGPINTIEALGTGHVLIGYVPDLLYAPELNFLDEFGFGPTVHIRSSSINAQHRLIAEGAGIGALPCFIAGRDPSLQPICTDHSVVRSFWIVTHRETQNLTRVKLAKEWLLESVQMGRHQLMPA